MPAINSPWTEQLINKAKELLDNGLSFGSIAEAIGMGRNAVIGKFHRMGLRSKNNAPPKRGKAKRPILRAYLNPHRRMEMIEEPVPPPADVDDMAIPEDQRKTLMQLEPWHCRYPVGDVGADDFFFCAAPKLDDGPYCASHAKRCFMPAHRRPPPYIRPQF